MNMRKMRYFKTDIITWKGNIVEWMIFRDQFLTSATTIFYSIFNKNIKDPLFIVEL